MNFIISNFKLNKVQLFGTIGITLLWAIMSYRILFPSNWNIDRMRTITDDVNLLRLIGLFGYSILFGGIIILWIYIWGKRLSINYWAKIGLLILGIVFLFSVSNLIGKIIIDVFLL
jgi:hypothetical protein